MMERRLDRWMTKPRRGDHNSRPNRCAWVEDATRPRACPKLLKAGQTGYCPGHQRLFDQMKVDLQNYMESKKKRESEK